MAENILNWVKDIELQSQDKLREIHGQLYHNQTTKSKDTEKNLESSQRKTMHQT